MLNKCDTRLGYHFRHNCVDTYGLDKSGDNEYKFNSLGFRGDEFNPDSNKNIFISGCSYTFGVGINVEETWGYQFKKLLAENTEKKLDDIGLMNFAIGGASNDYIARTLLTQSARFKPDLIIAYFTHSPRTEFIDENGTKMIGPWSVNLNLDKSKNDKCHLDEADEAAVYYYSYITPELEFINMIKNMLLLQSYCESRNINYILGSFYKNELFDNNEQSNSICTSLADLLNKKTYCDFNLDKIDTASDGGHPGRESNKLFAEKLFENLGKNIRTQSS